MSTNQLIIFMMCKLLQAISNLSTTVHCVYVVLLREINHIQQNLISENLSHIMCDGHYQFLQVGPQLPPM